jgi:hypothetical protein
MTLARVAISDLLGMLWSALVGISTVLDLCPSPDDGDTWKAWWDRKSFVGRTLTVLVWAVALVIVGIVAYKAMANTVEYLWS